MLVAKTKGCRRVWFLLPDHGRLFPWLFDEVNGGKGIVGFLGNLIESSNHLPLFSLLISFIFIFIFLVFFEKLVELESKA